MAFYRMDLSNGSTPAIEFNLTNGQVATTGRYITCNLEQNLVSGNWYFVSLNDPSEGKVTNGMAYYDGTNIEFRLSNTGSTYDVRLTQNTAGLYNYNHSWRDMYMKISLIPIDASQHY